MSNRITNYFDSDSLTPVQQEWSADVARSYQAGVEDGRANERRYGAMRWSDFAAGVILGICLGVILWL